jgi:ATP-dependent DNA helicase RecG
MTLTDPLEKIFRLSPLQKAALKRLGLITVHDMVYYFPARYSHVSEIKLIRDIAAGETVTLYGKISKLKTKKGFRSKIPMAEGMLEDASGTLPVIWFNQAYLAKMVHEGGQVELSGRVSEGKKGLYLANPELKSKESLPIDAHESLFGAGGQENFGFPVYPETRGITSRFLYHTIQKIFGSGILSQIEEYIPEEILKRYSLPSIGSALVFIHMPKNENHAEAARKRFAFEEIFTIQLKRQQERAEFENNASYQVYVTSEDKKEFLSHFPFTPTNAQMNAIETILSNIEKPHPMARLLEGDVGSGKTAVAATAAYAVIRNRPRGQDFGTLQVAYMAPTEILATQHFENFITYFEGTGIQIGLITGSGCRKFPSKVASQTKTWTEISRTQLLKWVANGEIPILLGTHALIQKSIKFKDLALVIVDEQHRFGALQRAKLAKKEGFAPHYLSMTATPIPRTLALTLYGDLDLTLLDTMPLGRKQVITEIVHGEKRDEAYAHIKKEMATGRQLYVICPRINEPDPTKELAVNARSVTEEAKRLKSIFPNYEIGILHSKMTKQKKEEVMREFSEGRTHILVATSVVEVGVNVPNATLIIIEGGERFGLAQLHQLRGRVVRSNHQAYCFVFAESKSTKTAERLRAFKNAKSGFELAELDLALRGAGELAGTKQWGISDLGMEAIKNIKMVEAARTEAIALCGKDAALSHYPLLQKELARRQLELLHFE